VKIGAAEIRHVALPLIKPWRTAYGEDVAIHSILVRLSAEGAEGWGESCPLYAPTYSSESAGSAYEICREFLLPRIVGREFETAAHLVECLEIFKGNHFAKAAVETAWWALDSKRRGVPLWQALGGIRSTVSCGEDFGVQGSIDELLTLIEDAVKRGYPRIKLKVKRQWDIDVLRAVRAAFPKVVLHVDCNAGYDLREDWETLRAFDGFGLSMIEQPLSDTDVVEHAELQRRLETPLCLDESIKCPRDFRIALEIQACRAINVKPGRVGGLQNAIRIHDMARDAGVTAWVGGMLESGVGAAICAALATLPGFTYPADIFPSRRFYSQDIVTTGIQLDERCCIDLKETTANGSEPNPERLERVTVSRSVVTEGVIQCKGR
jgi:o-succinylbenzoate synthase